MINCTESFDTKNDAMVWMEEVVNDSFIDNHRFAFIDDPLAMRVYEDKFSLGCCGFFDRNILVGGKEAVIGCNYGH